MRGLWLFVGLSALALAACGKATAGPQPAGPDPSPIAQMVCQVKAQFQISEALGEQETTVSTPTWVDHLYTCDYRFPQGIVALSVKELSSQAQTLAYFNGLGQQYGNEQPLFGLGQQAFLASNGSVVVRKDWKVLLVDTTRLSRSFSSSPAGSPAEIVATVIMGCWTGD
jgi:hypothetical protein